MSPGCMLGIYIPCLFDNYLKNVVMCVCEGAFMCTGAHIGQESQILWARVISRQLPSVHAGNQT